MFSGRHGLFTIAVASLSVAFQACGSAGDETGGLGSAWTATTDTIGDTIRVFTEHGQIWESNAHLVSEISIGVLDGEPQYQFGNIRAIAVGADGRMYVLDGHGPVLRMYAADGTWVQNVGREGEGPGEYKQPDSGLAMRPDGKLLLRDPGNGRISIYDSGVYEGSWPLTGGLNTSSPMVVTRDGATLTLVIKNLGTSVMEWQRGLARYHLDGTTDTLDIPDLGYEEAIISGESEGSSSTNNVPYTPEQQYTYSPLGYFITGISEDYSFKLLHEDGPVIEIGRDYEPVPVMADEASIQRRQITQNFRDNFPGWSWNGPPIPDIKPPYSDLLTSEGGRIWVRVHAESQRYLSAEDQRAEETRLERPVNPYREPIVFEVFEPTGEYLGRVETPPGFTVYPRPIIRDMTVWGVIRDELDVARLHRFRVDFSMTNGD